jgi:hypothetical protein
MNARTLSGSLVFVIAAACSSPKPEAYRRLASEVNPILTAMRPVAGKLLALKPEEYAEIIETCMSADEQLRILREIDFDAEHITPGREDPVSWNARDLLQDRALKCGPGKGDRARVGICRSWCVETWEEMIKAVDRLRWAAEEVGVEIVSLRP